MVPLWGIYGFMSFWSGHFIPISIKIPGRLNCQNVKGKLRNISTFQTYETLGLQMWETRGILWEKKNIVEKINKTHGMKHWARMGLGNER